MMSKLKVILIWLSISIIAGVVGSQIFNVAFWLAAVIAGAALVVNGLIAEWEDRKK